MCVVQGAVMNEVVNFSGMQYAVIEALQTEAGSERFVIAYRSEQSLHDVIARSLNDYQLSAGHSEISLAMSYPKRAQASPPVSSWPSPYQCSGVPSAFRWGRA